MTDDQSDTDGKAIFLTLGMARLTDVKEGLKEASSDKGRPIANLISVARANDHTRLESNCSHGRFLSEASDKHKLLSL